MQSSVFPACYPPSTRVNFQHPVIGVIQGVISSAYLTSNRLVSTHPDGLVYVIEVNCPNRGVFQFVKQPSDIITI